MMTSKNPETAARALDNLAGHRRLRENAEERWERSIGAALATGNSLRTVAEVAGVSHMTVKRIANALGLKADNGGEE
jgi:hypothetical protein